MTQLDLHQIVPEPPDELLGWPALDRRIRRRRTTTRFIAVVGIAGIVAGVVTVAASINGSTSSPQPLGPISHVDGRVVFGQDTTHITKTNLFADTSLYSISPQGGHVERLTHQADGIYDAVPSPDGRRIAYTQETYGYGPAGHPTHVNGMYVHIANADGSDDRRIYRCESSACQSLLWSPNGDRLLIMDNEAHMLEPDGHVAPLCIGGCPGTAFNDASWSPDGQQLAFQDEVTVPLTGRLVSQVSVVAGIGVMDSDGSNPRLLTDLSCNASNRSSCTDDAGPIWSPSGSVIAFTRTPASLIPEGDFGGIFRGPTSTYTIRADGTHLLRLACGMNCSGTAMAWSPDGRQLEFISEKQPSRGQKYVYVLHLVDTRTAQQATERLRFLTSDVYPDVVWAPSSTRIAIGARAEDGSRTAGIYAMSARAGRLGRPQLLTPNGLPPIAWLPQAATR